MRVRHTTASVLALVLVLASSGLAQNPKSDPQALALAAKSIATLTGGTTISDVTLTGNVTLIAGSDTQTVLDCG